MKARSNRSLSPSLLGLLVALGGCDGRYVIGNAHDGATGGVSNVGEGGATASIGADGGSDADASRGGAANADDGGAPIDTGAGGTGAATAGETSNNAGADGELGGEAGAGPDPDPLGRVRWLLVQTFPSSASTQTLLNLVDLQKPIWEGVTVESTSVGNIAASPDERWVFYYSYRKSATLGNVWDGYAVNMAGKKPGARQLLLSDQPNPSAGGCVWSPDSSRLACLKPAADSDSDQLELVFFGASGNEMGPEVAAGPARSVPTFFGPESVVYNNELGELVRLDLGVDAPATPTGFGLVSDYLAAAPDGKRALTSTLDEPNLYALLDVSSGEKRPLEVEGLRISPSYDAGVVWVPSPSDDSNVVIGTYYYYAVNGLSTSLVGQTDVTYPWQLGDGANVAGTIAGRSIAHRSGDRVAVVHVAPSGEALAQEVPGEYANVHQFELDPTGQSLYIEAAELDSGVPIAASVKHWVTRLTPSGPGEATLVTEGFATASIAFSPDGHWLLIAGDTYYEKDPSDAPFHLIDLSQDSPRDKTLPVALNWATPTFSRDSTYLSLIGGSLGRNARELSVFDLLNPDAPAQVIYSCRANPSPLPGCPNYVLF
jgi:hypothetical protein